MHVTRPLIFAALAAAALAGPAFAQDPVVPRLTVTGEGRVSAAPDIATVSLGVTERAEAAQAAMDAVSTRTRAVLDRLDALGIEARDRQTSGLSLQPVYADRNGVYDARQIAGFEASNMVTVRVRDIGALGDVLAAALDDGANRLGGLSFDLSEPRSALDEARRRAVADARAKAELLAQEAGVTLGPVLSISEGGGGGPVPMAMMMADARAESVPIAAGETTLSASVTMEFGIGQ